MDQKEHEENVRHLSEDMTSIKNVVTNENEDLQDFKELNDGSDAIAGAAPESFKHTFFSFDWMTCLHRNTVIHI